MAPWARLGGRPWREWASQAKSFVPTFPPRGPGRAGGRPLLGGVPGPRSMLASARSAKITWPGPCSATGFHRSPGWCSGSARHAAILSRLILKLSADDRRGLLTSAEAFGASKDDRRRQFRPCRREASIRLRRRRPARMVDGPCIPGHCRGSDVNYHAHHHDTLSRRSPLTNDAAWLISPPLRG